MQNAYESKLAQLEQRIFGTEQTSMIADRKGENNSQILGEMLEKLESRVLHLDQIVINLKNDLGREKENVNQLEFMNLRNNEDFRNMLGSLQNDFGGKLEIKITDLVNRILLEQEDRMRQVNDIKYQIDIKDKMILDKQKFEREEMRDRYNAMDAVVKAEF